VTKLQTLDKKKYLRNFFNYTVSIQIGFKNAVQLSNVPSPKKSLDIF